MSLWKRTILAGFALSVAVVGVCVPMAFAQANPAESVEPSNQYELFLIGPDGKKHSLRSLPPKANTDDFHALGSLPGERYVIGVVLCEVPDDVRAAAKLEGDHGLLIKGVLDGKPAALAGVQVGDILLTLNGKLIDQPGDVVRIVNEQMARDDKATPVQAEILRQSERLKVAITPVRITIDVTHAPPPVRHDLSPGAVKKLQELGLHPGTLFVGPGVVVGAPPAQSPEEVLELRQRVEQLENQLKLLETRLQEVTAKLETLPPAAIRPVGDSPKP